MIDALRLIKSLDGAEQLSRDEGSNKWHWLLPNGSDEQISFGRIELKDELLILETNSRERAVRGREMIESLAADAVNHRATSHEDITQKVQQKLRSKASPTQDIVGQEDIPAEVLEDLVLGHYARHYRKWVDESIPALHGCTPRQAAKDPSLRRQLEELIRSLEGGYERALREGSPAYDPSWMRAELGLQDEDQKQPPALAHERWNQLMPGFREICLGLVKKSRSQPGFVDVSTTLAGDEVEADLDVRRFLKELPAQTQTGGGPLPERFQVVRQLLFAANHELHLRKTFWVDEAIAYMLSQTDFDVLGQELRLPFRCFGLVFSDRHTLSFLERLLAVDAASSIAGHILRVATVYVSEVGSAGDRAIVMGIVGDALGADAPYLFEHVLRLPEGSRVALPVPEPAGSVRDSANERLAPPLRPLPSLIKVVVNAILYATSAGVKPEQRSGAGERRSQGTQLVHSSDSVFFLPGPIKISQVRKLQELARAPGGGELLHRFMVRGHWRRPAKKWKEQRLRWIEPHGGGLILRR